MSNPIILDEPLTVRELAERLDNNPIAVIKALMSMGVMANINQTLDLDTAILVSEEMGYTIAEAEPEFEELPVVDEGPAAPDRMRLYRDEPKDKLAARPPVVTILGHVDHGKTTLLDSIRQTRVVDREAGGITQHIGAYQVQKQGRTITFIDTPGHEAFTAMRRRGARGADIAVLVVAADDGMMPQSYEALDHVRAAGAQIVVALNKIDRENANPDRVYSELADAGLIPEQYGGETPVVSTSALQGTGIDELLDYILIVNDMNQEEIVANPDRDAQGVVIESVIDPRQGVTATLLVQNGTLKQGDSLVVGTVAGRIRAMFDWQGKRIKSAGPSTPVQILGLPDAPSAGDRFGVVASNKLARSIVEERLAKQAGSGPARITLEDVYRQLQAGSVKSLNVILKADVDGSLEPITDSLKELNNKEVRIEVLRADTGAISESDVMLAAASEAVVLGFGVEPDRGARERAESENVEIRTYNIIYQLLDDMERAVSGMLDPVYEPVTIGKAEVRQVFSVRRGKIAGCYVLDGKVLRNAKARLLRGREELWEGDIETLRRFTDDVREVAQGFECGISLKGYNDIEEGDIIEVYQMERVN
ncbi:MAG: translation initiation factor IF-2 [Anaerolineales bacterium]|nr:translation initiation factor IF-2 [Anaerolineales bacterium]MCB9128810.1 translation initiation factor IF-2 [Ardenticatenales bacterium]MCB9171374.1 translation initiation factor IF-2 [Ardenticatenales bacterium]